jgi:anthranilate synthase component 1
LVTELSTSKQDFIEQRKQGSVVTVLRSLVLDSVSPAALYEKLTDSRPGTFLLESADQDGIWSRYSFIGLAAWGALSEAEGRTVWLDYGLSESNAFDGECPPDATGALRRLYKKWKSPAAKEIPPLTSGIVGFIGWEVVHELENFATSGTNEQDCPNQTMLFVRDLLVIDHSTSLVQLVTTVLTDFVDDEAAWDAVQARLTDLESQLNTEIAIRPEKIPNEPEIEIKYRTPKANFLASIETAKQHISDGDIFQGSSAFSSSTGIRTAST